MAAAAAYKKQKPSSVPEETEKTEVRDREYYGALAEEIIHTETIFSGRVFRVEVSEVALPDGKTAEREIIRHSGGAAIAAVDAQKNILFGVRFRGLRYSKLSEIC